MDVTHPWPDETPEGTLIRAFVAFGARDGHALAALSSAASLAQYREAVRGEAHPQWHEWTAEALRSHQPHMPLAAAEWQVREMAASRERHTGELLRQFAGVASLDALCDLEPSDLLARALRVASRRATDVPRLTVLGHVREGAAAHVLFRLPWRGPNEEPFPDLGTPRVATLVLESGAWRLELEPHSRVGMPGYSGVVYIGDDALPPDAEPIVWGSEPPAS